MPEPSLLERTVLDVISEFPRYLNHASVIVLVEPALLPEVRRIVADLVEMCPEHWTHWVSYEIARPLDITSLRGCSPDKIIVISSWQHWLNLKDKDELLMLVAAIGFTRTDEHGKPCGMAFDTKLILGHNA